MKNVLETASESKAAPGSGSQLIGDFYASCLDEAAIEKAGATPLKPYFKQIAKIKTKEDIIRYVAIGA